MTIIGLAGSSKTFVENTLVSIVRKILNSTTSVQIVAPTGAAAFNAGGSTLHYKFRINSQNINSKEVTEAVKEELKEELLDTILLFLDERSMLPSNLLGRTKVTAQKSAHGGTKQLQNWGGIPIIVLLGDDKQLPSMDKGVLYLPFAGLPTSKNTSPTESIGQQQFLAFTEHVMQLKQLQHQTESETIFSSFLMKTREDRLTDEDIEKHLLPYHLESGNISRQQKAIIQPKALYVFTTKEQKNAFNMRALQKTSNTNNPVARIHHITYAKNNNALPTTKHFQKGDINSRPFLCEGAKVKIHGKNF